MKIISLGAGVQSSAMALMAAAGEITPMPDCAIFADTGWEPRAVYDHLEFLMSGVLPFPVHIVKTANIREDILACRNSTGSRFSAIPFFIVNPDGSRGMGRRQCTHEYKLNPIKRKVVEICDGQRKLGQTEMWIGISTDEASRMKLSRVQYIINRFPLIEKGMSRNACLAWMKTLGFPLPPKSSCIGCPYHSDDMWRTMRSKYPSEWADAVHVDRTMRTGTHGKMGGIEYMHRQCVPLDQVDLTTAEERGQINMFEGECEGICGL